MIPQRLIDRVETPDGQELVLYERDGVFTIRVGGWELMSSRAHGSEETLATSILADVPSRHPTVLVGGLGMGYTLRAVLDTISTTGRVVVAELLPAIVSWNRNHLGHLARHPLDDPRVVLVENDVGAVIAARPRTFDAILLDVDNGPSALADRRNAGLYTVAGLTAARRALRPHGLLGVWSAEPDAPFERALRRAGFRTHVEPVHARSGSKGPRHTIFVARPSQRRGLTRR